MGKTGILFAFVASVGTAVVFQNLFGLRDHDQLPADQLFADQLKCTAALVAVELLLRK